MSVKSNNTFVGLFLQGIAKPHEIDDYVNLWHSSDSRLPLHEFLGLTAEEYEAWVKNPKKLDAILIAYAIKHNCHTGKTTRIIDQLIQQLFIVGYCTVTDHIVLESQLGNRRNFDRIAKIIRDRLYNEHHMKPGWSYTFDKNTFTFTLHKNKNEENTETMADFPPGIGSTDKCS